MQNGWKLSRAVVVLLGNGSGPQNKFMLDLLKSEFLDSFTATPVSVAFLRLMSAMVLGGLIGWERERHEKSAGLRTHIMIALAACLFTLIAFDLMELPRNDEDVLRTDPLRLIEAVTSGVAFLAAGSIITQGVKVKGLTTGAGMWLAGAIGLTCGIGNIPLAALATTLALVVLWLLHRLAGRLDAPEDTLTSEAKPDAKPETEPNSGRKERTRPAD